MVKSVPVKLQVQGSANTHRETHSKKIKEKKIPPSELNPPGKKKRKKRRHFISDIGPGVVVDLSIWPLPARTPEWLSTSLSTCVCHYCIFCVRQKKTRGGEGRGCRYLEPKNQPFFFFLQLNPSQCVSHSCIFYFQYFFFFYNTWQRSLRRWIVPIIRWKTWSC